MVKLSDSHDPVISVNSCERLSPTELSRSFMVISSCLAASGRSFDGREVQSETVACCFLIQSFNSERCFC